MNCSPTLTAEEFKQLHNGLCELDSMVSKLLHGNVYEGQKLEQIAKTLRDSLKGAYKQDDDAYTRNSNHYESVKEDLGLNSSIWSIYEVNDLNMRHPFTGAKTVTYRSHWGNGTPVKIVNGNTWAALWVAANACIRDSGDEHHIFIEAFTQEGDTLVLSTGS